MPVEPGQVASPRQRLRTVDMFDIQDTLTSMIVQGKRIVTVVPVYFIKHDTTPYEYMIVWEGDLP